MNVSKQYRKVINRFNLFSDLIYFVIFCALPPSLLTAQPWIVSVSPSLNKLAVPSTTQITVTFNKDINSSAIESAIVVMGSMTGRYFANTVTYDQSNKEIIFTPAKPFKVGEVIQVSVTKNVKDQNGEHMPLPFVWQFWIGSTQNGAEFVKSFNIENGKISSTTLILADLNNDGILDAANNNHSYTPKININFGNPDGTFQPTKNVSMQGLWGSFNLGSDLDGDGDMDIIGKTAANYEILSNDGAGNFNSDTVCKFPSDTIYGSMKTADFNGDGRMDLLTCNYEDSSVVLMINRGGNDFSEKYFTEKVGFTHEVSFADFDNNGTLDVAVVSYNGTDGVGQTRITAFSNDGTGKLTKISQVSDSSGIIAGIETGDLNGDGFADIVVFDSWDRFVRTYVNNGTGKFTAKTTLPILRDVNEVCLQDLDGDGDLDIIVSDQMTTPGTFSIWKNIGKFNFLVERPYTTAGGMSYRTGDVDGDGDIDIVSTSSGPFVGPIIEVFQNIGLPVVFANNPTTNVPKTISLKQNYPNPFNGTTVIKYEIPKTSQVSLKIYDVLGREVSVLVNNNFEPGVYESKWIANAASGMYICRLKAQEINDPSRFVTESKKMQLIR